MRYLLIVMIFLKSFVTFGQLSFISPHKSYTQDEMIKNLKKNNEYYKSNFGLFFTGTKTRIEYNSNDSTLNNVQLSRLTNYNSIGEVLYDSLIFNDRLTVTQKLTIIDSLKILHTFKNKELSKIDTFIFDYKQNLIEHRTANSKIKFRYDSRNRLIMQAEESSFKHSEMYISYYSDSIVTNEKSISKYNHDIRKNFYLFNKESQIVEESNFTLKQNFRPPDFQNYYRSDTSSYSVSYEYDNYKNHIKTLSGDTRNEKKYLENRLIEEVTIANEETLGIVEYSYLDNNHVIKKLYRNDSSAPYEVNRITYQNGVIVAYISINNIFQFEQKKKIHLDIKGRILNSCEFVHGDENLNKIECKRIEYIDY